MPILRVRFRRVLACLLVLSFFLTASVYADDDVDDQVAEAMVKAKLSEIAKYVVTPFTDSSVEYSSTSEFQSFQREMTVSSSYELFSSTAEKVLIETGLCTSGSGLEGKLQDCANTAPDEFATVSNLIRYYLSWQSTELDAILGIYKSKLISPLYSERLEGRLVMNCIQDALQTNDVANAIEYCRDPADGHWDLSTIFEVACGTSDTGDSTSSVTNEIYGDSSSAVFDYRGYISNCMMNSDAMNSAGHEFVAALVPNFTIEITQTGVEITMAPPYVNPAEAYSTSVERIYSFLYNTDEDSNGDVVGIGYLVTTEGCIPGFFAPDDFGEDEDVMESGIYYSICIPGQLVSLLQDAVSREPQDAQFQAAILAKRLAVLDVLEGLNGAALVAQETYRVLNATDSELGRLAKPSADLTKELARVYREAVEMTYSSSLEDVIKSLIDLNKAYKTVEAEMEKAADSTALDIKILKDLNYEGAKL
jgi:hypothetical protein